ncbi:hypothetical protein [Zobellella iuensis]|uniref:Uncharacterized protein n=1 Tax=Zobellella iuensis TaxID=2803811 RepID=A0ABS1QPJ6_9GAMM|nr:hypothetical protein [Zobellella iuensis]MBL1376796.1 hypothetical protein [Zobellella iuensis]
MPWLSAFTLLLYLSLLCSPPAPVVAEPSLLAAADQHAQVVNPPEGPPLFQPEQEGNDDPEQGLSHQHGRKTWPWLAQRQLVTAPAAQLHFLTERQVRAPPLSVSHTRHRDQLA